MRTAAELIGVPDPAWPMVQDWIAAAKNPVSVLPPAPTRAETLQELQVTLRSPMGAIVFESGGILVDSGWLRVLGSGSPRLPRSLTSWNRECGVSDGASPPPFLLVADDLAGGFFAINGGGLDGPPGAAFYLAPDTLAWQQVAGGFSALLQFFLGGDLDRFYSDLRWSTWRADAEVAPGDRACSIYPFLWADGPPIDHRSRALVPILELWSLAQSTRAQLGSG